MRRREIRTEVGVFANEGNLLAAAKVCRDRGVELVAAHSPHPIHGIDSLLEIRPTRLPYVTFFGGALGLAAALWFQYWSSSIDYPLNVGGKPFDSLPAFLPVAFDVLILGAGLLTVAAFIFRSRLYPGKDSRKLTPRITDDRFALIVRRKDASLALEDLRAILDDHGALECWSEVQE